MTNQRVWPGEAACFGHDSDEYVTGSRSLRSRTRWDIVWAGILLLISAAAGWILFVNDTGMLGMVGFAASLLATVWVAGFFLDPIYASASAYFRRRKMHVKR